MQVTQPMKVVLCLACLSLSLSGCTGAKVERGAIAEDGFLKNAKAAVVEAGAFQQPVVKFDKEAISIIGPLLKVDPNAVPGPLVAPNAVEIKMEREAIVMKEGAIQININVLPQKPPALDTSSIVENLKTVKPVGDLSALSREQQQIIMDNAAKFHAAILALIGMIQDFNKRYAALLPEEKK